ncbi:MAG: DNA topoisomerase IB [Isosphaeraceae bacterium]
MATSASAGRGSTRTWQRGAHGAKIPENLNTEAPQAVAREAGLRYVGDESPGIRRVRSGRSFRYVDPDGRAVRDAETLGRIRALAIPPAWTDVWICPRENGHIQATGRDDRGRKQYRYHARWRSVRDEAKYGRTLAFGRALARIRRKTEKDLRLPGLPRRKVLAAVVRLLETTLIRIGNDEYARTNHSFGLTTMRDRHAQVEGGRLEFRFRGKSGIHHTIEIDDPRLARVVGRCQELPGQELFQYIDEEGEVRDVGSDDVNEYLREVAGEEFTAKDFRTWAGTVLALIALQEFETFDTKAQAKKNVVRAIEAVARKLGNTPNLCRKCYIHPVVVDAYLEGTMLDSLRQKAREEMARVRGLSAEESAVLALLQRRLAAEEADDRSDRGASARARRRSARSPHRATSRA